MKVLLAGHNGYIGSILAPLLAGAGHCVSGLDTYYYAGNAVSQAGEDILAVQKDIRDIQLKDVRGYDALIHLAGLSYDRLGEFDRELTYEINYKSSVRLAGIAKEAGVQRFLGSIRIVSAHA